MLNVAELIKEETIEEVNKKSEREFNKKMRVDSDRMYSHIVSKIKEKYILTSFHKRGEVFDVIGIDHDVFDVHFKMSKVRRNIRKDLPSFEESVSFKYEVGYDSQRHVDKEKIRQVRKDATDAVKAIHPDAQPMSKQTSSCIHGIYYNIYLSLELHKDDITDELIKNLAYIFGYKLKV